MYELVVFSVYDAKASAFITPFFLPTMELAIREFSSACNDQDHKFGKYPQDYTLYKLGTFDYGSAKFSIPDREVLITGIEAKQSFITEYGRQMDIEDDQEFEKKPEEKNKNVKEELKKSLKDVNGTFANKGKINKVEKDLYQELYGANKQ